MNSTLKRRLAKLEEDRHVGVNAGCPSCTNMTGVILPDLDRTPEEYESLVAKAATPSRCGKCGRNVDKKLIVVEFVEDPLNVDGALGEVFSE